MSFDALTDKPIYRWRAVRRTRLAPRPWSCPSANPSGYHRPAGYSVRGEPL